MINFTDNVKLRMHFVNVNALWHIRASLVAQLVKNPPAMRETWVRSLGWEDRLEKEMATHSSVLASRIPGTGALGTVDLSMA